MQLELIQFVHRTANVTFTPLTRNTPHRRQNPKLAFIIHRWHKGIPHTKNCGVWNVKTFRRDLSLLSSRFTDHRGFEGDGNVFFFETAENTYPVTKQHIPEDSNSQQHAVRTSDFD